jgi:hypothetical protein
MRGLSVVHSTANTPAPDPDAPPAFDGAPPASDEAATMPDQSIQALMSAHPTTAPSSPTSPTSLSLPPSPAHQTSRPPSPAQEGISPDAMPVDNSPPASPKRLTAEQKGKGKSANVGRKRRSREDPMGTPALKRMKPDDSPAPALADDAILAKFNEALDAWTGPRERETSCAKLDAVLAKAMEMFSFETDAEVKVKIGMFIETLKRLLRQ